MDLKQKIKGIPKTKTSIAGTTIIALLFAAGVTVDFQIIPAGAVPSILEVPTAYPTNPNDWCVV